MCALLPSLLPCQWLVLYQVASYTIYTIGFIHTPVLLQGAKLKDMLRSTTTPLAADAPMHEE